MDVAAQITRNISLAEHPFVARLSRFMMLSAADLRSLEQIIESERLVKKRNDLVVVGQRGGPLTLHRLLRRRAGGLVTKGDWLEIPDPPWPERALQARGIAVSRGGQIRSFDSRPWRAGATALALVSIPAGHALRAVRRLRARYRRAA